MRFGLSLDLRNPPEWEKSWPDLYAEHLDLIAWTEALGFTDVWFAEHHAMADGYMPSPLVFGAAVAARTRTLRIGTGVALAPFYHPVRLAEDTAVIDNLSNGRFELTLGIGYLPFEADAYGFDSATRGSRTDEILQILPRLWQGETVTFSGKFYRLKNARIFPLPAQKPRIPLFVGAVGPAGLRRAALYGDGYSGPVENYADYLGEVRALGKPSSAARIYSMSASDMWMFVTDDPDQAAAELAPHVQYQIRTYSDWKEGLAWAEPAKTGSTESKFNRQLRVYTPDEAIAHIRSRLKTAPIEAFCIQCPAGLPLPKYRKYVEAFAAKVIPAFR